MLQARKAKFQELYARYRSQGRIPREAALVAAQDTARLLPLPKHEE